MQESVGFGAGVGVAAKQILGVVLEVVGEVAELRASAERRECHVHEEVLAGLGLELLPLVGAGDASDQRERGPWRAEDLGEGGFVLQFAGAGESSSIGDEVDQWLEVLEVFFEVVGCSSCGCRRRRRSNVAGRWLGE